MQLYQHMHICVNLYMCMPEHAHVLCGLRGSDLLGKIKARHTDCITQCAAPLKRVVHVLFIFFQSRERSASCSIHLAPYVADGERKDLQRIPRADLVSSVS